MRVYLLQQFDPWAQDDGQYTVLNIFATRQAAVDWRNHYIATEFDIDSDSEHDMLREVEPTEFFITSYQVLS